MMYARGSQKVHESIAFGKTALDAVLMDEEAG